MGYHIFVTIVLHARAQKAKKKKGVKDVLENQPPGAELPRKSIIRRAVNKVNSEADIFVIKKRAALFYC